MEAKLQELTDKIYREGVERARQEAEAILAEARAQAEDIVGDARREAERARQEAAEAAEEMRRNVTSELQLSGRQAVSGLKQEIAQLISTHLLTEPLDRVFTDKSFLRQIIETMVQQWHPDGGAVNLALLLPESEREQMDAYFTAHTRQLLNKGLELKFDNRLVDGFRIGPADGSYVVSFTADDFERFFRAYLRPHTAKMLYGS